jgi:hypothetical protein
MQAKEIHTAIETLLRHSVSWSSTKNALAANVSGPSPWFVRVAKGRYGLRAEEPDDGTPLDDGEPAR